MFAIPSKKVAILFNPRTGSHTHHEMLWRNREILYVPDDPKFPQHVSFEDNHIHTGFGGLALMYRNLDMSGYRVFAFYRDPADRFLSALNYFVKQFPQYNFHDNMSPRAFYERDDIFKKQVNIIQSPWDEIQIELFNFHDFVNETIRMFCEIGITITPDDIPANMVLGKSGRELTDKDRVQIRKYWHEDYEFFEEREIVFT